MINKTTPTFALKVIEDVCHDFDGNGIFSVGARAALAAMAQHWKDHLGEGHGPRVISDDIDELKKQLEVMRAEIMTRIVQGPSVDPVVTAFLEMLQKADSVQVDSPLLTSWEVETPTGTEDNQLVRFSWVDDEHPTFSVILTEGAIAKGQWVGKTFVCTDADGDDVHIDLFQHIPLTPGAA